MPSRSPRKRLATAAWAVAAVVLLLVVWEVGVDLAGIPSITLPPPSEVWEATKQHWPALVRNAGVTFGAALAAFSLCGVIGMVLAFSMFQWERIRRVVFPVMVALQAAPKIALAPLLLTWVGFGVRIEVFMGVLIGIFPVIVNTMAGLDTLSSDLAALGRSMRAKPLRMFLRVRLPHALPHIVSGLKTASVLTIVGVVVGEFTGSNAGLGYLVLSASSNFDTPYVFSALIFLTIGSLALFYAISYVESRVAWYRSDGGQAAGSPA